MPANPQSTVAAVVCQSSDAAFHFIISAGVVQQSQTRSIGALTVVSTKIFMPKPSYTTKKPHHIGWGLPLR
jgi:hypothetical protein